jgi:hypothetical protein
MSILVQDKLRLFTHRFDRQKPELNDEFFGEKVGLLNKIFGCGHRNISRPFGQGKIVYRCCMECGARKQFNPETLETFGKFYYPPMIKTER